jgi:hypothetical protein
MLIFCNIVTFLMIVHLQSDILEKVEYQDEPAAKKSRQKETNSTKRTYVLKWNLYEDLKQIVVVCTCRCVFHYLRT